MDIQSGAIASYQRNQSHSGAIAQSEALISTKETNSSSIYTTEDHVSLSSRRQIFDWIAQELPRSNLQPADISRASHALYEYQILSIEDLNTINSILAAKPDMNFLTSIQQRLAGAESFSESQQLRHLNQVFSTLAAAELMSAA